MRERVRAATGSSLAPWGHVAMLMLPERMSIDIHPAMLIAGTITISGLFIGWTPAMTVGSAIFPRFSARLEGP